MLLVKVYANHIVILLQVLGANDFEDSELSTKFRDKIRGDTVKTKWHLSDTKIIQITQKFASFAFKRPYKVNIAKFLIV